MTVADMISSWKRLASNPEERVRHRRVTLAPSPPSARLAELEQEVVRLRQALGEAAACAERYKADSDRFHDFQGVSFGGIPMAQHFSDMLIWEAILNDNPQIRAIFELGTWQGGFSWWLWAQAEAREIEFHTYDSVYHADTIPCYHKADVFAEREQIGELMRSLEPVVVFCDNGNKPRELREYALELRHPESLLLVHDWGTEMPPEEVPDTVEMIYGDFCEHHGSVTRAFKLRQQ